MTSPKERCFEAAWKKYKETFQDDMDLEVQKPWGQRTDGTWDSNYSHFWNAINSFMKYVRGEGGTTQQVRIPDLTVNQGGRTSVLDLKFTRADGTIDSWSNRPGAGTGTLQQDDYNDINRQMNDGNDPHGGDPRLDPEKCGCDQPNGTQTAPIRVFYDQYSESFSTDHVDPLRPRLGPIRLPKPARAPVPGRMPGGVRLPPIRVPFP